MILFMVKKFDVFNDHLPLYGKSLLILVSPEGPL